MRLSTLWWFFLRPRRQKILPTEGKKQSESKKNQEIPKVPPVKEVLFNKGEPVLGLTYCTDDINPIIDKMNTNLKSREERAKSLAVEIPIIKEVNGLMEVDYDGQHYSFKGKGTEEEFRKWFLGYFQKGPSCITCDRIIFPDEAVGECNKGVMHMNFGCCPSGGFFVGHLDDEGKIIPYTPKR